MSGHTKWSEIKHKRGTTVPALQVVVYDITGKNLPKDIVDQVTEAVDKVVKKYDTLATTVVTE